MTYATICPSIIQLFAGDGGLFQCPHIDPKGKTYLCGAWLRSMECTPVRSDTACAVNTASIVVTFVPPYTVDDDDFCYNQPDDITPYGVANLLKDYIIKDIKIDIFDRRRKY